MQNSTNIQDKSFNTGGVLNATTTTYVPAANNGIECPMQENGVLANVKSEATSNNAAAATALKVEGAADGGAAEVAPSTLENGTESKARKYCELPQKHPLQNKWTFWYLENDRSKTWEEMLNEIISFDTVEDFWSIYNHIKPPSEILMGSDYSLFKTGVRPMWEDVANKEGGRWIIPVAKFPRHDFDQMWMDTLLCLIGEVFDSSDQVCGAVANVRGKNSKISVWTADGYNREAALEIGCKLKEILGLGHKTIQYQLHKDTMVKSSTGIQALYTV